MTNNGASPDPADAVEEAGAEARCQQYIEEAHRTGSAILTYGMLHSLAFPKEVVTHFGRLVREMVECDAQRAGLTVVGEIEVFHLPTLISVFGSSGGTVGVHTLPPLRTYVLPVGVEADTMHTVATARAIARPSASR